MNFSERWDVEEGSLLGRSKIPLKDKPNTIQECEHKSGIMIPQKNKHGDYIKPEFMICNNCRLVLRKEI